MYPQVSEPRNAPAPSPTLSHSSFCTALSLRTSDWLPHGALDVMTSFQVKGLIVATCAV